MEKLLSGWGRNKFFKCRTYEPKNLQELIKLSNKNFIARGMGRSYGDSSIQKKKTIITKKLNKIIFLDEKKKVIKVETGIIIKNLIEILVSKNLFLPVTPGSKYISIGGMIASDVHGKNHHKVGSFRNHIDEIELLDRNGKLIRCSKNRNRNLFNYTIGGMGLTGLIYSCKFKLKSIKTDLIYQEKIKTINLQDTIKKLKQSNSWEYNVAWIDTSSIGSSIGRSIIYRGYHYGKVKKKNLKFKDKHLFKIFNIIPNWLMNNYVIKFLNNFYYLISFQTKNLISINDYFYQLDKIKNWNYLYGNKGFISYQVVFPERSSFKGISKILDVLRENKNFSFVSVLKYMGRNDGYNSFGMKGYTLVLDFPINKKIYKTLNILDTIVINNKGRIYLCKDSRITYKNFLKMKSGFLDRKFINIRKNNKYFFNSEQSTRLKI